jgi:hypothetical protein
MRRWRNFRYLDRDDDFLREEASWRPTSRARLLLVAAFASTGVAGKGEAQEAGPPLPSVTAGFAVGEWLPSDATIELVITPPLDPASGSLAVFVGETDMTPLFTATPEKLTYRPVAFPLPAGESEIAVHLVTPDGRWQEIARFPLRVLTRGGFEKSSIDPKLDLANDGQVAEGHFPEESRPPRETYQDLTANTGFTTVHVRSGWTVQSQFNAVGVTHREQALRFSQERGDAPLYDLSDYRVDVERGIARGSLGHVSFGGNRHLIQGFASRGATLTLRFGTRADLSAAALHGSSIVGWDRFTGVERRDHRIGGATLGLEAFPSRPAALRLEATYLTGSLLPLTGFNEGAVNDAEESRGWGLRVLAVTPGQRGRLEAGYSRSRFDNPNDPLLAQGVDLVEVRETTRGARYLEAGFDLVPSWSITPTTQARLTAAYRHERVEPLYRSVAAFVQADRTNDVFELQGSVGELSFRLAHQRYHDNLDGVPSILTTRGRERALTLSVPVAFLVGASSRPRWLPHVSYGYQRTHQKGDGVPENSGARPTFVPDQVSAIHGLGLDWQGGRWRVGYRFDRSSQDNRQPEREKADSANRVQTVSLGFTPVTMIDLGLDLGLERAENKEIERVDRTRRVGVSVGWRATGSTTLGARWSTTHSEDDAGLRDSDASDVSAEIAQRLDVIRWFGGPLPGQVFLRYGRQRNSTSDREFAFDDSRRNWTLNTGLNLSVF